MPEPLPQVELLKRRLERATLELSMLRSSNRKMLRAGGLNVENVIREFREVIKIESEHPFKFYPEKIAKLKLRSVPPISSGHFEIASTAWSDWHVSENVRPEDSNGVNAYSSTIAANRVWELVDKQRKIIRLHESMYPIKSLWISILGDMINGTIHEELRLTNDLTDVAAAILCSRLLIMAIEEMAGLGIPIDIDCVIGNHPRQTAKMPTKAQAQTSYDWLIYEMIGTHFAKHPTVNIHVHTGQLAIVNKLGWRYVLEHGIDWKNAHEEEFESRIRDLFDDPIYRAATGLRGSAFDQIVIGNLHKPAFMERTIKNGSLTGQNELGQAWRLKPIKAQQLMWGISKSHVRTWQYQVDVTSIKDSRGDNPFVEYARAFVKRNGRGN